MLLFITTNEFASKIVFKHRLIDKLINIVAYKVVVFTTDFAK